MDGSLLLVMAKLLLTDGSLEADEPYLFVGLDRFQQYAAAGSIVFCRAEIGIPLPVSTGGHLRRHRSF